MNVHSMSGRLSASLSPQIERHELGHVHKMLIRSILAQIHTYITYEMHFCGMQSTRRELLGNEGTSRSEVVCRNVDDNHNNFLR